MANSLIVKAPTAPDFHLCDEFYNSPRGRHLILMSDCLLTEAQIPRNDEPIEFFHSSDYNVGDPPNTLPYLYYHGTCEIEISAVDPVVERGDSFRHVFYNVAPGELREMAGWVISQCVGGSPSTGGLITKRISNAINFLSTVQTPMDEWDPGRSTNFHLLILMLAIFLAVSATFLTLAICSKSEARDSAPGVYDPAVGGKIFTSLHEALLRTPFNSPSWNQLSAMAERIGHAWGLVTRSYALDRPWWGRPLGATADETTTYECDAKLGNPRPRDCSQLQYSAFPAGGGDVTLRTGVETFLHSESCSIGISAAIPTPPSWARIQAAVNDLVEICVNNPLATALGGRAHYGRQDPVDIGGGIGVPGRRTKKFRKDVTALDALPPGANITLFQQLEISETFPNAVDEARTCTWLQVVRGRDVRACAGVHHHRRPTRA